MEEYRKEAQRKYEEKKQQEIREQEREREKEREQEQEKEREREREKEREREREQEREREREFNEQWMIWMTLLSEDTLHSLHELTLLVEKIPMQQYKHMAELVEQLNSIQETRNIDATEARLIHDAIVKLIQFTKIDIEIQAMDTSQDEDYARRVEQQELEQLNVEAELQEVQGLHAREHDIPICSIEKRLGLNVTQLREIARNNNIKIKGNKRDLCLILSDHGLVRIV